MKSTFISRLRRFCGKTEGNVSLEMVFFAPVLFFVIAATFTLHDAFRQKSLNIKAAYTISDALSRETDPVDSAYLDGMVELLEYLTSSNGPYSLRITLVRYDADADAFDSEWTQSRGDFDSMQNEHLETIRERLPDLLDNERVILVETETSYRPPIFFSGFGEAQFNNIGFTRPRFAPKIVWSDG